MQIKANHQPSFVLCILVQHKTSTTIIYLLILLQRSEQKLVLLGPQNDVRVYDEVVLGQGPSRLARLAKWGTKLITHNVQNLAGDHRAFDNDLNW